MSAAQPIILHHFDQSPFSEKIRIVFGFKKLAWKSVRISRIMPRPDLIPMTGGYRRTPVMQIGADIYCDTQIIIRELERRFPQPTLFPGGHGGLPWMTGMWTDRPFFQSTVGLVFGKLGDRVPAEFIADRSNLRGAPFNVAAMTAVGPQLRDQFRAYVGWIDAQLGDGRDWLLGDFSLADVSAFMNLWYVLNSLPPKDIADIGADRILDAALHVRPWIARIRAIGHGTREEMSTQDALRIGTEAVPQTAALADPGDPNGRKPGDQVTVASDDYERGPIAGDIVSSSAQHIAIRRHDPVAGDMVIHFPRAGFLVKSV